MKISWFLAASLLVAPAAIAQESIPAGTLIPVSLTTGLNAAKVRAGRRIEARIMQDVPGTPVRRRDLVIGHVVAAGATSAGKPRLAIRFDSIRTRKGILPLRANLRALASFMVVGEAEVPEEMGERGITPEVATTEQIGGEQVYRGGGNVASGDTIVGEPLPYGVLGVPRPNRDRGCRGMVNGNHRPQPLWLFSTDACGLYGFDGLRIEHRGRTDPTGNIVLTSTKPKLTISGGSGLLLRVQPPKVGNS